VTVANAWPVRMCKPSLPLAVAASSNPSMHWEANDNEPNPPVSHATGEVEIGQPGPIRS
jgi:hypothetical protein